MAANQIGDAIAEGVSIAAKFEQDHPDITAAGKAWVQAEVAKATPKQKMEVAIGVGIAGSLIALILVITGHPLQAGEVAGILSGIGLAGHGIQNKFF